jgi:hypothetical protein
MPAAKKIDFVAYKTGLLPFCTWLNWDSDNFGATRGSTTF